MCAAVVLGVFITIALLDSVHFRPRLSAIEGASADAQVRIAMAPGADSVNVASATGIALHALHRA